MKLDVRIRSKKEISDFILGFVERKEIMKKEIGDYLLRKKRGDRDVKFYNQNCITKTNKVLKKCDIDDLRIIAELLGITLEEIIIKPILTQ